MTLPIVKRYLIAFEQYKFAGLTTFMVALGLSGGVAALIEAPPVPPYKATGIMTYQSSLVSFSQTGQVVRDQGQQINVELFLSPSVIGSALKDFNIDPREFKRNLSVRLEEGVTEEGSKTPAPKQINVAYKDPNQERSVAIVNILMKVMVDQSRQINAQQLQAIIQTIQERLKPVAAELKEAEKNLEEYDKKEGATLLAVESGSLPQAILSNEQQQKQVQLQLDATNTQIQSLKTRLGLDADQAYVAQALTADPIIAQLRIRLYEIESQLAILRKDYRDQHPLVADLLKQQQATEKQLQERASEVLGGGGVAAPLRQADQIRIDSSLDPTRQQLAQSLIGLQTQKETLEQQLVSTKQVGEQLRREYATIPNKQMEKQRLEQQIAYKKALYDQMQAKLADAQAAEAEIASSLRIAQEAIAPEVEVPQAMSAALVLAIGGLAGVLGGAVIIFVLGMLSGKFYTWEEIRGAFQEREVPLLGVLPTVLTFDDSSDTMPLLLKPHSPYLEFYEKVRSNLQRVGEKPPRVVLVTSVGSTEGKTFSAYNLAIAAARIGKRTLLIEADLRSPSQVQSLRLTPDPFSSREPLRYYGDLDECVRLVPDVENLYVIPSPGPLRQGTTILESSELKRLLREVRYRFDLVIVDTPSLSANNDALTLEPYTDGMVIVARPVYTQSSLLAEITDKLTETDDDEQSTKYRPRLLGAIINGADIPVQFTEEEESDSSISDTLPLEYPSLLPEDESIPKQLPPYIRR